jgi:dolichyl-phosphate-mannose--protein O-mannosyl transferase
VEVFAVARISGADTPAALMGGISLQMDGVFFSNGRWISAEPNKPFYTLS